jgi:hypothetical protein
MAEEEEEEEEEEVFLTARTVTVPRNPPMVTATRGTGTVTAIQRKVTASTDMKMLVGHPPPTISLLQETNKNRNLREGRTLVFKTEMATVLFIRTVMRVVWGTSQPLRKHFHLQHPLFQRLLRAPRKVRTNV